MKDVEEDLYNLKCCLGLGMENIQKLALNPILYDVMEGLKKYE